jgi:hypothetical protein
VRLILFMSLYVYQIIKWTQNLFLAFVVAIFG